MKLLFFALVAIAVSALLNHKLQDRKSSTPPPIVGELITPKPAYLYPSQAEINGGEVVIAGYIQNNCPFSIFNSLTATEEITPETGWWDPHRATADMCSHTIHLTRHRSSPKPELQIEYSVDGIPLVWYNLSHQDGTDLPTELRVKNI
ncbi:hypothetical protein BDV96DRAFT_686092 [Lophiotrema nucula]|uniref:Uncharacterized protein n=1 Tax=Lophiotrema nucula TaxID=690887 RepID=A0A6A5ZDJ8_9PLEO|nr:hypothetical protein BDV96DRAFT_686092 [Lophiotrema nucula]